MQTLQQFSLGLESVPAVTSWYLADIADAKGRQELFTKQAPQGLKVLREHALIESAVSSREQRMGLMKGPCGEKTGMIISAAENAQKRFSVADLQMACPNVSIDLIRRVLKDMQVQGRVECLARGQKALWRKAVR